MMMVASIARPCRQAGKQEAHRHEMKEGQEQPYRNTQYWLALLSNTPVFGDHASLIVCCFCDLAIPSSLARSYHTGVDAGQND
jgi:hypothetical protein